MAERQVPHTFTINLTNRQVYLPGVFFNAPSGAGTGPVVSNVTYTPGSITTSGAQARYDISGL